MNPPSAQPLDREQRLDEAVLAYLRAVQAGQTPSRQEWLARYPDLVPELADFLDDQEKFDRATAPLRSMAQIARNAGSVVNGDTPPTSGMGPEGMTPRQCGPYELLDELGRGGMGVVNRARHQQLQRVVALKRIRVDLMASPVDVQRFRNEAQTAAALDHPHIVPLYEVGEHDGQLYFSMKLIGGGSLADLASRRAPHADFSKEEQRRAAALMATVARAVHHAHQHGVLHRDLKPANILLDANGQPHVSDFGLARRLADDNNALTRSGEMVGTPSYMAPEQAMRAFGPVTAATDVPGLGAILYALLTGRPPYLGETALDTLDQLRWQQPLSPRAVNPQIDRELETICLKCLEKDPQRRYGSAGALAEDLECYRFGKLIQARRASFLERLALWCRRPERVRNAGVSLVVFSALLIVWCLVSFVLMAMGLWTIENPTRLVIHSLVFIVVQYLPMMWCGMRTMQGSGVALYIGCIEIVVFFLFVLSMEIHQWLSLGGLEEDKIRVMADSLFLVWSGYVIVVHGIALIAYYSNKTTGPGSWQPTRYG
jgi:eukaryotic-like serine/threonine-protein kinase